MPFLEQTDHFFYPQGLGLFDVGFQHGFVPPEGEGELVGKCFDFVAAI